MRKLMIALLTMMLLFFTSIAFSESAVATLQEMYATAELKMATGDYSSAAELFEKMGSYSDCSQMAMYCKAISAAEDLSLYDIAIDAFTQLGDFKDCSQMVIYYTGRAGEAAADRIIENFDDYSDEDLNKAKEEYLALAKAKYTELALFKDSMNRIKNCGEKQECIKTELLRRSNESIKSIYATAKQFENAGEFTKAIDLYKTIPDYEDVAERILICWYNEGARLSSDEKYAEAAKAFLSAEKYADAPERYCESWYLEGFKRRNTANWEGAVIAFNNAGNYKDSMEQIKETHYLHADDCVINQQLLEAIGIYQSISDYKDSNDKVSEYTYEVAKKYEEAKYFNEAKKYYESVGNYEDAPQKAVQMQEQILSASWYPIRSNGKFGFCTQYGEVIMECQWTAVSRFDDGLSIVKDGDKKAGAINKLGEYVFEYENCVLNKVDGYIVKWDRGHTYGLYDYEGACLFETKDCRKFYFGDGIVTYLTNDYGLFFYNIQTKKTVQYPEKAFSTNGFSEGWCVIEGFSDTFCLGTDYKTKVSFEEGITANFNSFHDGMIRVQKGSSQQRGYADTTGKTVIPCKWGYYSGEFSEGLVNVQDSSGGKWGYIDKEGNQIIELVYEEALPFSEGLACVTVDDKAGYIDRTGAMVIEPQFDSAYSFDDGLATVEKDGKQYYINQTGDLVLSREYSILKGMVPVF